MSNKKTNKKTNKKKVSLAPSFNRFNAELGYGASVEIHAWTVNDNRPLASIDLDDGSADGRPWGCSSGTTVEIADPNMLRAIAESLLEAADFIDARNAENAAKIKEKLAKRKTTIRA